MDKKFPDGRESIEHQLELHVTDLHSVEETSQFSLSDILAGLRYVMDYRIKGGKMPNLDYNLCKRLATALLSNASVRKGRLGRKKLTPEAHMSFELFGEFMEEERECVGEFSAGVLRSSLKFHLRIKANEERKMVGIAILSMLTGLYAQFKDWRDLVNEEYWDEVEQVLKGSFTDLTSVVKMPIVDREIHAPQALYFDRDGEKVLKMFNSDIESGLKSENVEHLREVYGDNVIPQPPKPTFFSLLINQLKDFMVIILIIVTVVIGVVDKWPASVVLAIVVIVNVTIGLVQEIKANK
ncbi:calcium ATPase, partial [Rozella allomycis CSF55]